MCGFQSGKWPRASCVNPNCRHGRNCKNRSVWAPPSTSASGDSSTGPSTVSTTNASATAPATALTRRDHCAGSSSAAVCDAVAVVGTVGSAFCRKSVTYLLALSQPLVEQQSHEKPVPTPQAGPVRGRHELEVREQQEQATQGEAEQG